MSIISPDTTSHDVIADFTGHLRGSKDRATRTAAAYASVMRAFFAFHADRREPQRADIERFLARPTGNGDRQAPSTRNQALAALRAFTVYAIDRGLWLSDPTAGMRFSKRRRVDRTVLEVSEVHRFFRALPDVDPPRLQSRDRAILGVFFTLGLRVSELARLDLGQVDLVSGMLLGVERKGGVIEDLPLEPRTLHLLREWLAERPRLAGTGETALFVSRCGTRMSVRSLQRLFERIRVSVGTAKHATPHTARHSFITTAIAEGAELTAVADVAGHADVNTTRGYVHLARGERRNVVQLTGVLIPSDLAGPPGRKSPPGSLARAHASIDFGSVDASNAAHTRLATVTTSPIDVQDGLDDVFEGRTAA